MLVIVFIIFALILGLSLYSSYIAQKNAVIDLIVHSSVQLSETIGKASKNTIIGYKLYRHQFQQSMLSNLYYAAFLDSMSALDRPTLRKIAREEKFTDIYMLNKQGHLEVSSGNEKIPFLPQKKINDLIQGKKQDIAFELLRLQGSKDERIVVGVHRQGGGAILGTRNASRVLGVKRIIDVNVLLNSITSDTSIKYITIQDSTNILYSTASDSFSDYRDDKVLQVTYREKSFNWRITQYNNQKVIEAIHYVKAISPDGEIIRIGLDYAPIQQIQNEALKQASIRLLVLIVLGFIMIAYSIAIQNNQLLENEKKRITREVTDLQNNLVQKEKLSAIGELSAGVAHKIRNPLNAISMTVQRLATEFDVKEDGDEFKTLNSIVKKEIIHITEIINQFLQFSRPNATCKTNCDVNEIISHVISLYETKITKREITLRFSHCDDATGFFDDDKIKQSMINLIENAIHAVDHNGRINISTRCSQQTLSIEIADTGVGISHKDIPRIYNLYFTTKPDGTGIGLAQVYRIVSEHDGKIDVKSQLNHGTKFTIHLPRKV